MKRIKTAWERLGIIQKTAVVVFVGLGTLIALDLPLFVLASVVAISELMNRF